MDLFDFIATHRGQGYGIEYKDKFERWVLDPCFYSSRKVANRQLRHFRKHFAGEFRLVRITANVGLVEE